MITQRYKLNMIPDGFQKPYVSVSQYDKLSRTIEFELYSGSIVYNVPSGSTVTVRGTKSDNTGFEYPCTFTDNVVSFDIEEQITVLSGVVPAELRITLGGAIIGSANFGFKVERTPLGSDIVISETDIPRLEYIMDHFDEKMDLVSNPNSGNILITDENGQAQDSAVEIEMLLDLMNKDDFSWGIINNLVKSGNFSRYFAVGDQIEDKWSESENGTEYTLDWNVVHIDSDGAYLQWDYTTPTAMPFDSPEAIYVFDGTEEPGDYYITIGTTYGTGWVANNTIKFTLTAKPDEGDQLFINCGENNANDPANGRTWNVYAKGSTTSKQSGTTSSGSTGTSLGTIGATNAQKPEGRLNGISRVVYGYGRWSQSAIRQYLNSDDGTGEWWSPQNDWDRPPAVAATMRGFLAGYSQEFLNILEDVEVVTSLNTVEGFAEDTETTLDKIFLPSLSNMYIDPQYAEGTEWDYYKDLATSAGLTGKFVQQGTYAVLISYNIANTSSPVSVRLRSPYRGYASGTWHVNNTGNVNYYGAYYTLRSRPACLIKKSS